MYLCPFCGIARHFRVVTTQTIKPVYFAVVFQGYDSFLVNTFACTVVAVLYRESLVLWQVGSESN
jgi:hypothetical protein